MTEAAHYSAIERLRDGRRLEVRALVPGDRDGILKAFNRASPQSLRRRFFAAKRELSEKEIEFFSEVVSITSPWPPSWRKKDDRSSSAAGGTF